jgi:hypothetical protein
VDLFGFGDDGVGPDVLVGVVECEGHAGDDGGWLAARDPRLPPAEVAVRDWIADGDLVRHDGFAVSVGAWHLGLATLPAGGIASLKGALGEGFELPGSWVNETSGGDEGGGIVSVGGRCDGVGDVGGFGVLAGGEAGGGRWGGVDDDQGFVWPWQVREQKNRQRRDIDRIICFQFFLRLASMSFSRRS